ncbi:hypothetical protein HDU93_006068 [Gonapodya sp. JEL0774]|nr:hypothetical protein HDU93_006068 [Gonapodya sp. JEL0774]
MNATDGSVEEGVGIVDQIMKIILEVSLPESDESTPTEAVPNCLTLKEDVPQAAPRVKHFEIWAQLSSASGFFKTMLEDMNQAKNTRTAPIVPLPESISTVSVFCNWLHLKPNPGFARDNVADLLAFADKYEIPRLTTDLGCFLELKHPLGSLDTFVLADRYNLKDLKAKLREDAYDRLWGPYTSISGMELARKFHELSTETLGDILSKKISEDQTKRCQDQNQERAYARIIRYLDAKGYMTAGEDASTMGSLDIVKLLLKDDFDSSLQIASRSGGSNIVLFLLDHSYSLERQVNKNSALHQAASAGHKEAVRILLEYGADIGSNQEYAIRCAAQNGDGEMVRRFLDRGASVSALMRAGA